MTPVGSPESDTIHDTALSTRESLVALCAFFRDRSNEYYSLSKPNGDLSEIISLKSFQEPFGQIFRMLFTRLLWAGFG